MNPTNVFTTEIPRGAPVVVVLIEQEGCGACEEYHPIFVKMAAPWVARGLPVVRLNAATEVPDEIAFMDKHGVHATPTVIAATLYRGPVARIDGAATEVETQRLFYTAWAHNRPAPSPWG